MTMTRFDVIYSNFFKEVFQYVKKRLENRELAEELTQDVFVKICENKELLEEATDEQIRDWLFETAHKYCEEFSQKYQFEAQSAEEIPSVHLHSLSTETNIYTKELRGFLKRIFRKLKKNHQQAIYLFDIQHFTYKECAEKLGISEEAFGSLLRRARKAFLEQIVSESNPSALKQPLSRYELTTLLNWFDMLDFPENVEEEISLKTKAFFNGFIQNFDSFRKSTYPSGLEEFLLSLMTLDKNMKVADFGSGTGVLTEMLSPRVDTVYAVDHSVEMVNKLKKLAEEQQLDNVVPLCMDISSDLRELENSVDAAFCCMVLHHVFAPQEALTNIAKTLIPGGHLIVADLTYTSESWMFKEEHDFWSGFKIPQLKKWLRTAGLEIIDIKENHSYLFQFENIKEEGDKVSVPLLYALCKKTG